MRILAEQLRLATRPLSEATPEELMENLVRLNRKEAEQWIKTDRAIRASMVKQGRCPDCGDKKHKTDKCPLKVQGDREITREIQRRYSQLGQKNGKGRLKA